MNVHMFPPINTEHSNWDIAHLKENDKMLLERTESNKSRPKCVVAVATVPTLARSLPAPYWLPDHYHYRLPPPEILSKRTQLADQLLGVIKPHAVQCWPQAARNPKNGHRPQLDSSLVTHFTHKGTSCIEDQVMFGE